jgi:hypothetical protein
MALAVGSNPRLSVRDAIDLTDQPISRESIRMIRHEMGYHFYDTIPVPPLTQDVKRRRVAFCLAQLARDDFDLRPIDWRRVHEVHHADDPVGVPDEPTGIVA